MFINNREHNPSLNDLCSYLSEHDGISVTKQGLHERFSQSAVDFLKSVLSHLIKGGLSFEGQKGLQAHFNRVLVKDSTKFNLYDGCKDKYPGFGGNRANSSSTVSIQYEYDFISGRPSEVELTPGTRNDQRDSKEKQDNVQEGDLLLRDLGYVTLGYLKNIIKKGAFFLNRLGQGGVYDAESGKVLDFTEVRKKLKNNGGRYLEYNILLGKSSKVPCRMVVSLVSEQNYQQRIKKAEKAAKSKGYAITDEYRAKAAMDIFITNAKESALPTDKVAELYRIRWQVELAFKNWKSLCKINLFSKVKVERFECQLLAKLIWAMANWSGYIIANQWIGEQSPEEDRCSTYKFYKQACRLSNKLREAIWSRKIEQWLVPILEGALDNLVVEKRKGKISINEVVEILKEKQT